MIKIVVSSEEEKEMLLEASMMMGLSSLGTTHPGIQFLSLLCANPGFIEVSETHTRYGVVMTGVVIVHGERFNVNYRFIDDDTIECELPTGDKFTTHYKSLES